VVQAKATRNLLARFFAGSADALVLRLVEDEQISTEQLDRLRKSLSQRKRKGG
jgi:BlaI family transcriptional regulator, penicillinase repressor